MALLEKKVILDEKRTDNTGHPSTLGVPNLTWPAALVATTC